jgi:phenylpyruvate tautomerase PptA (4-oxalocrotonate tautomerase family)
MPFYRFTVPTGGATLRHKAEVAAAMTKVHSEVTGAPARYVHCAFVEVAPDSIFVAGEPATGPRMVGLLREGRSPEIKAQLLHGFADAWSAITGDAKEDLAIFLHEVPGANVMEDGVILPEAADDPGAVTG